MIFRQARAAAVASGFDEQVPTPVTAANLRRIVERIDRQWLTAFAAAAVAPVDGLPYSRRVVLSRADIEVMVAKWRPGAACLPHDHGASSGLVQILAGTFEHTTYRLASHRHCLEEIACGSITAPAVMRVSHSMIHAMAAGTTEESVTLHWYTPRITAMKVYANALDRGWVVSDDCGAWQPSPTQVVDAFDLGRDGA